MKIDGQTMNSNAIFKNFDNTVRHDKADKSNDSDSIASAVSVVISEKGRKLSQINDVSDLDEAPTKAEAKLKENADILAQKKAKKKEAAEIEDRIATDDTLTDKDKATLQKQADKLKEEGKTSEDRYYELQDKKNELEKQVAAGKAPATVLGDIDKDIEAALNQIKKEGAIDDMLHDQAIKERALKAEKKMREDLMKHPDVNEDDENKQLSDKMLDKLNNALQEGSLKASGTEQDDEQQSDASH